MVDLPSLPTDSEFEDYVAACLQAAGFFVEKSLIQRDDAEVLELDLISTKYKRGQPPRERLIEVKSGGWGFPEIFKISGWGKYLSLDDLCLIVCKEKKNQEFFSQKSAEIGVNLHVHSNDMSQYANSELLADLSVDIKDVTWWRFSLWLDREILKKIKEKKKDNLSMKCFIALDQYFHTLNSDIYFTRNVSKRIDRLYKNYQSHPNISKKLTNELIGADYDDDHDQIPNTIFKDTFYRSDYTELTLTTYVEHRARLAILKAAVDFALFEDNNDSDRTSVGNSVLGSNISYLPILPDTFQAGLRAIREEPYFFAYPNFWQSFLWFFGGFILEDKVDSEYRLMSLKTGIPVDHIDNALAAYEKLFPVQGGWFHSASANSNIRKMKMMCSPFHGIGANVRRTYYTIDGEFEQMELTGKYTMTDLISWNNLAVRVLE